QCNRQTALSSYFSQLKNPPIKIGWVGSGCSTATEPTAELTHFYNITQLSCVSSSPDLQNRERFRYYFQLVATNLLGAHGFFGIIQHFGWRKVRLVAQDENVFTATMDVLKDMLDKNAVEYTEVRFRSEETVPSINAFNSETRIYVLAMDIPHARDALCEAYRRGFHYPKYVIITFGGYVRQWWEMDAPSTNCTAEERAQVLLYSLAAVPSQLPREQDEYTAEPNITLSEFNSLYHEVVRRGINSQNNLEEFTDYIFPYAYQCNEATLAYAYALSKTIADLAENETLNREAAEESGLPEGETFTMANFTYANSAVVSRMSEHLQNTMFPGISGNDVRFNHEGIRDIDQTVFLLTECQLRRW
ncbi:Gamma-aminobutyric acid type B receptor subunit 1, partial [Geodia barretti]